MMQYGDHRYDGQPGDADQFLVGELGSGIRTMEVGVAWTIDVTRYVQSGRWYLVPLLTIKHDPDISNA